MGGIVMSVRIAIERVEMPTVFIRSDVLSDKRLTWAARGMHAFLFATWPGGLEANDILYGATSKDSLDVSSYADRIKKIQSCCLELERFGYARREQDGTLVLLDHTVEQ